jgi:hypothetical protein
MLWEHNLRIFLFHCKVRKLETVLLKISFKFNKVKNSLI